MAVLPLLLLVTVFTSPSLAGCPSEEWHASKGTCYRFVYHYWTWSDALDACGLIQENSTLASVHDLEQNAFVAETVCGYGEAWLGLRRPGSYMGWDWVDGSPTNFTQWGYNQPASEGEQCAIINGYTSGQWISGDCQSDHASFVCQIPEQ
ncbi:lectin BRA-3-like [Amphibalanus amphitrite]|uniref:lectin BRA-3-like n=1 Tax=Amphibalanus amphitrite TaxID=1232801 RepID=UPI001C927936|nr:lectin BRA-3-like [Amphibalanus amphitrite]